MAVGTRVRPGDMVHIRPGFCREIALKRGRDADMESIARPTFWPGRPSPAHDVTVGAWNDPVYKVDADDVVPVLDVWDEPGSHNTWVKVLNVHGFTGWLRRDWVRKVEL